MHNQNTKYKQKHRATSMSTLETNPETTLFCELNPQHHASRINRT